MKETVIDVLLFLFDNYLEEETETQPDREALKVELSEAGFTRSEVDKAFGWLDGLNEGHHLPIDARSDQRSIRIFCKDELSRLDTDCRGYLLYLEQSGILSPAQRELAIDRIMALDSDAIDIDQVKWVVLMVLFNQPGQEDAYARMEDLVFEEKVAVTH